MNINDVRKEVEADVTLTEENVRDLMGCVTLARKRIDEGTTVATGDEISRYDRLYVDLDHLLELMEKLGR